MLNVNSCGQRKHIIFNRFTSIKPSLTFFLYLNLRSYIRAVEKRSIKILTQNLYYINPRVASIISIQCAFKIYSISMLRCYVVIKYVTFEYPFMNQTCLVQHYERIVTNCKHCYQAVNYLLCLIFEQYCRPHVAIEHSCYINCFLNRAIDGRAQNK